ncbi:hypothetical protein AAMO2058_000698100, partial [Amorphochlora amoebiformis]
LLALTVVLILMSLIGQVQSLVGYTPMIPRQLRALCYGLAFCSIGVAQMSFVTYCWEGVRIPTTWTNPLLTVGFGLSAAAAILSFLAAASEVMAYTENMTSSRVWISPLEYQEDGNVEMVEDAAKTDISPKKNYLIKIDMKSNGLSELCPISNGKALFDSYITSDNRESLNKTPDPDAPSSHVSASPNAKRDSISYGLVPLLQEELQT